eukprot:4109900-Pleurochrysis_carterae.AAC.1
MRARWPTQLQTGRVQPPPLFEPLVSNVANRPRSKREWAPLQAALPTRRRPQPGFFKIACRWHL